VKSWLTRGLIYHPAAVETVPVVCAPDTPTLRPGQPIKVLNWNVQYMAGKGYVFWYDTPDNKGPHTRPSAAAVRQTLGAVARVIAEEDPDLVFLQEVDDRAARTGYQDQLARLLARLGNRYPCWTRAYYWKSRYVPHRRVRGAVGLTMAILSKYRISAARRYQLAIPPAHPLRRAFGLKRAILEARLPVAGGPDFVALTTHLDAFAQGSDTMARQVAQVDRHLAELSQAGYAWVIGGDFNLLPPDPAAYTRLRPDQQHYYLPESEIAPLFAHYQAMPGLEEVSGPDYPRWFTQFPNDPAVPEPDRTIDYLFIAPTLPLGAHTVRHGEALTISDHLPLIAELIIPLPPAQEATRAPEVGSG
jgi:endonuclease/exonuclease/phosphatase family metal-dependent hydrolase